MLGLSAEGVVAQDGTGWPTCANPAALRLLGLASPDELLEDGGRALARRFEVLDSAGQPVPLEQLPGCLALTTGSTHEALLCWRTRADGEERWLQIRGTPIFDEAGAAQMSVSFVRDVTAARRTEADQKLLTTANMECAGSLDPHQTLHRIARLALPRLGDWCAVYLLDRSGTLRREVLACAASHDGSATSCVSAGEFPNPERGTRLIARALHRRAPLVLNDISEAFLQRLAGGELQAPLRRLAPRAAMVGRLMAGDRVLGAIVLIATAEHRRYDERDLALASEFAHRAALAVDNARLYTAERSARERADQLQQLTAALSAAVTARSVAEAVITHASAAFGALGGALTCLAEDGSHLQVIEETGLASGAEPEAVPMTARTPAVTAVSRAAAVHVDSRDECVRKYPDHLAAFDRAQLGAALAIPLLVDQRAVGALELGFPETRKFDESEEMFLLTVGYVAAQALERSQMCDRERRARAAADAAERRSGFLAEVSRLLSSSRNYPGALQDVVKLAVPYLADWCRIDLVAAGTGAEPVARERGDGAAPLVVSTVHEYPPRAEDPGCAPRVVLSGETEYVRDLGENTAHSEPGSAASDAWSTGCRSYICIPMRGRGRAFGAVTLVRTRESGLLYERHDVKLAEDFAHRVAVAVDNARLHAAALSASHAKANFLTVMSHELRTPLTAVLGYTELIRSGVLGPVPPAQQEQLSRIEANGTHLVTLIQDLLDFAHFDAGGETRYEPVRISDVVRDVVGSLDAQIRRTEISCSVSGAAEEPPIVTDPDKLRQILLNLVSNAVKFTERGEVRIEVDRADRGATIRVHDTGVGIAAEHIEKIFDGFWQVAEPRTRTTGGMGVGLALARQLSRLLGGALSVESVVGRGSTFTLVLPERSGSPEVPTTGERTESATHPPPGDG